jgi:DNA-binding CsgD family transcriptional regulator
MDLTAWTQRAADELAATGATARPRRPLASEPLTSQETRVALLVARGLSNREVAAALFLSPNTVEHHLASVFRKRGYRSPPSWPPSPGPPSRVEGTSGRRVPGTSPHPRTTTQRVSKVATTSSKALSNRCAACGVGDGQGGCRQTRWQRARSWQEPRKLRQLFPNGKVLSCPQGPYEGNGPASFPLVSAVLVGATGFEPVTSSVSAKYRELLCGRPFSQVAPDRRGRSKVLTWRSAKCSVRVPDLVGGRPA